MRRFRFPPAKKLSGPDPGQNMPLKNLEETLFGESFGFKIPSPLVSR